MFKQLSAEFGLRPLACRYHDPRSRNRSCRIGGDAGMSTAEYAIGTVAAAAFASLLYTVLTSESVTAGLTSLVQRALEASF